MIINIGQVEDGAQNGAAIVYGGGPGMNEHRGSKSGLQYLAAPSSRDNVSAGDCQAHSWPGILRMQGRGKC